MREAMAAANLALACQRLFEGQVWFQLGERDPPDFRLLRASAQDLLLLEIFEVEHTSFDHACRKAELATRVRETHFRPTRSVGENYLRLVEVAEQSVPQIRAVYAAVRERNIRYKVWMMKGRVEEGAETIDLVALNTVPEEIARWTFDAQDEANRYPGQVPRLKFQRKGARRLTAAARPKDRGQPYPWPDPFDLPY